MNTYTKRLHAFWAARNTRERGFLAAGAAVLGFGLLYGLLIDPLLSANAKLAASLPKQRAELRLLRTQVEAIERLRAEPGGAAKTGSALVHAIETTAAARGVRQHVTSLTPLAGDRVQLRAGPLPVGSWLTWFGELEAQGISALTSQIRADESPGMVHVEAVLSGGSR
jgi:general secretion pathway protein M